jgi:hypothetical protein
MLTLIAIVLLFLDSNFGAVHGLAAKQTYFAYGVLNDAIVLGVNGEVAAELGAFTGALGETHLANDNLTSFYNLATKDLNAKALTWTIMNIFGCTAGFDV